VTFAPTHVSPQSRSRVSGSARLLVIDAPSATDEEHQWRKRRLLKGSKEFRIIGADSFSKSKR
jgi:hypothetical protein